MNDRWSYKCRKFMLFTVELHSKPFWFCIKSIQNYLLIGNLMLLGLDNQAKLLCNLIIKESFS